ncbi:MAG: DNA polymerase IV [Methylococcales bacterium]|nr:DNA polymerase IV [Methylococcales bacterium]
MCGRKIIHIDMDAFFAAIEARDFPEYRYRPIIVGGQPHARGVVSTCNYEARQYGIHSAMPSTIAYRLCPQAIFIKPRIPVYRETSEIIRKIFARYTPLFEPLSLDEAYLDVSNTDLCQGSATLIAQKIKKDITEQTQLIASAGVSYNKFLAKIASDMDKPDGLYLITPTHAPDFIENLKVNQFHGVGKATYKKMLGLNIQTGNDLKRYSKIELQQHFGKAGLHYYNICRGIDLRPVNPNRQSKSVGTETTFKEDILDEALVFNHLEQLFQKALMRLNEKKLQAKTLTVKIKYHNFIQITRSRTFNSTIKHNKAILPILKSLLADTNIGQQKIRLLGISLSSLSSPQSRLDYQYDLFN